MRAQARAVCVPPGVLGHDSPDKGMRRDIHAEGSSTPPAGLGVSWVDADPSSSMAVRSPLSLASALLARWRSCRFAPDVSFRATLGRRAAPRGPRRSAGLESEAVAQDATRRARRTPFRPSIP